MDLEVRLGETPVGVLSRSSDRGDATRFRFYDSYKALVNRPVLGQVYEDHLDEVWGATQLLPPFFSNLLPEGMLREYIAEKVGVHRDRELFLLAHLGLDLPGAVLVRPLTALDAIEEPALDTLARHEHDALRFSLAGVQLKFSMMRTDDKLVLPMHGQAGHWIVKLPDQRYPQVPETEWSTMTWARATGIEIPPFELVPLDRLEGIPQQFLNGAERLCYAIERFDRTAHGRVHMEDFAQIFGIYGSQKYEVHNFESIGNVIYRLCGLPDLRAYVRRLVFMVMSGNGDAHHKNWSLLYPDRMNPRLSPAYDLVSTVHYIENEKLALKFAGQRDFAAVTVAGFERMARKLGRDPAELVAWVTEDVERCWTAWSDAPAWPLPPAARAAIDAHLQRLRKMPGSIVRLG
jgi:serine/threonine-protein kinase HipA